MLAESSNNVQLGRLDQDIHLPSTAKLELVGFIAQELPRWRDHPDRPNKDGETTLTEHLCDHLNSAAYHSTEWSHVQVRTETGDETRGGRKIDLTVKPRGLALIIEGIFRHNFGSSGQPYDLPDIFRGAFDLGFMFLPKYRAWVVVMSVVVCLATWYVIEKTKLGGYLRAGTENPKLVQSFGINVPLMVTLTYAFGVGLAGLAGVMAAPVYLVNPTMGSGIIIVVFAVVVIGGMGSILGSILTGLALGLIEGLTKVFYPEASSTVVFIIMAIVLLIRPAGLFGREK